MGMVKHGGMMMCCSSTQVIGGVIKDPFRGRQKKNIFPWWDYLELGGKYYPDMDRLAALERGMKTWANWVDTNIDRRRTQVLFQTIFPIHYNLLKRIQGRNTSIRFTLLTHQVGVQGLRILKPHLQKDIPSSMVIANGVKEFTDTVGGIGLEVRLILCEENADDELTNWEVENLRFSIKQPIEPIVTKDELQHLTFLCKSEIDSIGRITAGIIRLLKLDGSVGQSVIDQLGNLEQPAPKKQEVDVESGTKKQ